MEAQGKKKLLVVALIVTLAVAGIGGYYLYHQAEAAEAARVAEELRAERNAEAARRAQEDKASSDSGPRSTDGTGRVIEFDEYPGWIFMGIVEEGPYAGKESWSYMAYPNQDPPARKEYR